MARPEVIVVAGPTASGKTTVGIELAKALNGEIISADARQIYRWMDIGTAKPTVDEQALAKHHLIDIVDPDQVYNAGQFAQDASTVIQEVQHRGKIPIVVGGAGLYLKALFDGFSPMPEIPEDFRLQLQKEAQEDLHGLYERLLKIDVDWANKVQPTDTQRIIRGLEVFEATGKTLTTFQNQPRQPVGSWNTLWFGVAWPREVLYDRINSRAQQMVADGLLDEVKSLSEKGYSTDLNALNTFGYKEFFKVLKGELTPNAALIDLQQGTRRYAKRQLTWFRAEKRLCWINGSDGNPVETILRHVEKA